VDGSSHAWRAGVRGLAFALLLTLSLAGCGAGHPLGVPEPARSPPLTAAPAGRVVAVGASPEGLVADGPTGLLAVAVRDGLVLLHRDGRRAAHVRLGDGARHLALAAPGGPVLVPNEAADRLRTVSLPRTGGRGRPRVLKDTAVGLHPHDATMAAGRAFVGNEFADSVSVVQPGRAIRTLRVPRQPGGLAASGGYVGVVAVSGRRLAVIDAHRLSTVADVPCGRGPTHVVAFAGTLLVADTQGQAILVYALSPHPRLVGRVPLPGTPYGLAVDPVRRRLWVTLTATNRLVALDLGAGLPRPVLSLPVARQPNSVAVDPVSATVYVTGTDAGVVEVIPPTAVAAATPLAAATHG